MHCPRFVLAFLLLAAGASAQDSATLRPPVAKKVPHKVELHGETRLDDYFWLKDKTNPEVIKHLEAENVYTAAMTGRLQPLADAIYGEMLSRIKQTDQNVPYRYKGYWYYSRTVEGKQYSIHCRKKGSLSAAEEVLLDVNALAEGQEFMSLGARSISDDGNLLAYSTDVTGYREYEVSVKDLRTGKLIESKFVKASQIEWAADNKTLFYVTEDDAKRDHKVWRHTLGEPREKDTLVLEEKDELFTVSLSRSADERYLFLSTDSFTSSEQRYLQADQPAGQWRIVRPREPDHEYSADHAGGKFYILTNLKAKNFRVVTCSVENTDPAGWQDLVPHDEQVLVEGISLFKDFAVVSEQQNVRPELRVIDLASGLAHRIEFPESVYYAGLGANAEFDTRSLRLAYSSPVTPWSDYEYDMATGGRKLLKRTEVPGGFDPGGYQTERTWATAPDGTKVPISLVYKKSTPRDGSAPCLLYGYGAYGASNDVYFDTNIFSYLDRGVVYAVAHVRGGSELGRTWYDNGKVLNKKNTFTDFIACADHLVAEKYCSRERLAIHGVSAGGLLMGAVLNERPDLCKAAVLEVPFVDAINSMLDETIPLTAQEFEEWGNPKLKDHYDYMKTYCPYSNLRAADYPAMLVKASLNDSQVLFHEPAKYVAKLRTLKTDSHPLLLKCNMEAGHGGSSGRYDNLKEEAFVMAFVLDQMGLSAVK
jgi:oligopeptidase B